LRFVTIKTMHPQRIPPTYPLFVVATIPRKHVEFHHQQDGQPTAPTTTPLSIKQPEEVVKFAASALCGKQAESVPRSAGCLSLGAGKVFDAFPKQPTKQNPEKPLHRPSPSAGGRGEVFSSFPSIKAINLSNFASTCFNLSSTSSQLFADAIPSGLGLPAGLGLFAGGGSVVGGFPAACLSPF